MCDGEKQVRFDDFKTKCRALISILKLSKSSFSLHHLTHLLSYLFTDLIVVWGVLFCFREVIDFKIRSLLLL